MEFFLVGSWKKFQVASGHSVQLQSLEWLESLAISWVSSKIRDFPGEFGAQQNAQDKSLPSQLC